MKTLAVMSEREKKFIDEAVENVEKPIVKTRNL